MSIDNETLIGGSGSTPAATITFMGESCNLRNKDVNMATSTAIRTYHFKMSTPRLA